jgi:hypothetical protein
VAGRLVGFLVHVLLIAVNKEGSTEDEEEKLFLYVCGSSWIHEDKISAYICAENCTSKTVF